MATHEEEMHDLEADKAEVPPRRTVEGIVPPHASGNQSSPSPCKSNGQGNRRKWIIVGSIAAFLLVLVIAIGVGVGVSKNNDSDDSGCPFSIPFLEQEISPVDGSANARFGAAVVYSGNYLFIGAPGDNALYVYEREGTQFSHRAKLLGNDGEAFGSSIGYSDNRVVVGAPGDSDRGKAYIYSRRSSTEWTLEGHLQASVGGPSNDGFGAAVAIDGNTVVVGAPARDGQGQPGHEGKAFTFTREGTMWNMDFEFTGSGSNNEDFGSSVAIYGDTVVVGDDRADLPDPDDQAQTLLDAGTAHIFVRRGISWARETDLNANEGSDAAGDWFGTSVDIEDETIAVGAPNYNDNAGAVYLYSRRNDFWEAQPKITGSSGDRLGETLALSGNILVVSLTSDADDKGGFAVYERTGANGFWTPRDFKSPPADVQVNEKFASSLAVDAQKTCSILAGAPEHGKGTVFVYKWG